MIIAEVANLTIECDLPTVRKQWQIPWTKKLKCWLSFECVRETFDKECIQNVGKMLCIFLLLLVARVKYIGNDYRQSVTELIGKKVSIRFHNCKLSGYKDGGILEDCQGVQLSRADSNGCSMKLKLFDWKCFEHERNHWCKVSEDKSFLS